jgi:hypothetical protein
VNLSDLGGKLAANKTALTAAGAAGVVGLALMQRKKAGGDVGAGAPASGGSLATPAGQVVYDSSVSDAYNALQPQLTTIGQQLNQLLVDKSKPDPSKTIPVPAPPAPSKTTTPAKPAPSKVPAKVPTSGALLHPSVLVRPGDTLASIANFFYGNPDANRVYNANVGNLGNKKYGATDQLPVGTYLAIPN